MYLKIKLALTKTNKIIVYNFLMIIKHLILKIINKITSDPHKLQIKLENLTKDHH